MKSGYREELVELSSWRVATALAKRHPQDITVFIGHPGGGQSDVLWLLNRKNQDLDHGDIMLNRNGTISVSQRFDGKDHHERDFLGTTTWEHYLSSEHVKFIQKLERAAGLPIVSKSPKSTNRILTYQLFVRILARAFIENGVGVSRQTYTIRNGYFDSSGVTGSSRNKDIMIFNFDKQLFELQDNDLFKQQRYRFWILYEIDYEKGGVPKVGLEESSGTVIILKDEPKKLNLMKIYNSCGRNLDAFYLTLDDEFKDILQKTF